VLVVLVVLISSTSNISGTGSMSSTHVTSGTAYGSSTSSSSGASSTSRASGIIRSTSTSRPFFMDTSMTMDMVMTICRFRCRSGFRPGEPQVSRPKVSRGLFVVLVGASAIGTTSATCTTSSASVANVE
jgi:hypothetical protein